MTEIDICHLVVAARKTEVPTHVPPRAGMCWYSFDGANTVNLCLNLPLYYCFSEIRASGEVDSNEIQIGSSSDDQKKVLGKRMVDG